MQMVGRAKLLSRALAGGVLVCCWLCLTSIAVGAPDIYRGRDDRVKLDSVDAPYAAIGRVNLGGGRQFCTGVLVAPDRVVTAAHCFTNNRTRKPFRASQVHFVTGQRRNTYLGHSAAACIRYLRGTAGDGAAVVEKFADDAAVIILKTPINVAPASLAAPYFDDPGPLSHPAYSRKRPYLLSVHSGCKALRKSHGTWLTDCDTSYGSSGGPVFVKSAAGPKLAAIMSGLAKVGDEIYSVALPITLWGKLIEDAQCSTN